MAKSRVTQIPSLESIIERSGALEVFGNDFEGRLALLGFLKDFSEGNIGDPEDISLWMLKGKLTLDQQQIL